MIQSIETPQSAFVIHPDIKRTLIRQNANPFDCVRELVSNGLDAGAKVIWVQLDCIVDDLFTLQVLDNGVGMTADDLKNYAFKMFASHSDREDCREGHIAKFGIGLFSTLAVPNVQLLLILTQPKLSTNRELLFASVNPKNLKYEIRLSKNHSQSKQFFYPFEQNDRMTEIPLDIPDNEYGTNVCVLFKSSRSLELLRKDISSILKYHFRFLSRKINLYMVESIENTIKNNPISLPIRVNSCRPAHFIKKRRLWWETTKEETPNCPSYSAWIDCEPNCEYEARGLFILTGDGVVLASYKEFPFFDNANDVSFDFDHCTVLITIQSRGIIDYPISRGKVHELEPLKKMMLFIFWDVIFKFAMDHLHATIPRYQAFRIVELQKRDFLHFIQNLIGYLKSCEKNGILTLPDDDKKIKELLHQGLYKRQIFPLYNGEYHPWASLAEEAERKGFLRYFNNKSMLEELQRQRIEGNPIENLEFIVHTEGNKKLLTYYKHCFCMQEVDTDYKFELLTEDDEWMYNTFYEMIRLGNTDPKGMLIKPTRFRQWTGKDLSDPPLYKNNKQNECLVNVNSPLIRKLANIAKKGDPYLAGHLFEKLYIQDIYSADKRREMITQDAIKRLSKMEE